MSRKQIILGTRGSQLALAQAGMVKDAIERVFPDTDVVFRVIVTTGDKRTDLPLSQVAKVTGVFDKGVFLKEIEMALESGEIDMAVHSLKDMPSELPAEFELAAVLPRAGVEDVLISRAPQLPENACIATGSVRRRCMGQTLWGDNTRFTDLRGNVQTRLSKLAQNTAVDGIILARAGLDRLGLFAPVIEIKGVRLHMSLLSLDDFVPAAGQGIIGIETRKGDQAMKDAAARIDCRETHLCARAEREFLKKLGADCSTPVGVYASLDKDGKEMTLGVMLYEDGNAIPIVGTVKGDAQMPEFLAGMLLESLG